MDADEAARRFVEIYSELYHRYSRRIPPSEYRPTPEALSMLRHLAGTGPLTIAEAGKHFGRSQSATSELVDRMERRGLLERMTDERDRRRNLVWLTGEGRRVLGQSQQVLSAELLAERLREITEQDRRNLLAGLEALLRDRTRL